MSLGEVGVGPGEGCAVIGGLGSPCFRVWG